MIFASKTLLTCLGVAFAFHSFDGIASAREKKPASKPAVKKSVVDPPASSASNSGSLDTESLTTTKPTTAVEAATAVSPVKSFPATTFPAKSPTAKLSPTKSVTKESVPAASATRVESPATQPQATEKAGTSDLSPPANSAVAIRRVGIPQIHGLRDGQSSKRIGGCWFGFSDTLTGSPPTMPSAGAVTIPAVKLQGVYLGSSFASTNATTKTTLETYLSFLATSTYLTELQTPYGVSSGSFVTGKVISATLPQYSSTSTYLLDSDIVTYLAANMNNGTLMTPTSSTVYLVYVEPGVAVDAGGGSTSINSFLGYHNTAQFTATGGTVKTMYYAVLPYPGSPNPTPGSQGFSNVTDELTAVTSHEVAEAVTDPDTVNGWQETVKETFAFQLFGWTLFQYSISLTGEEIGDVPLLLNNYSPQCYARFGNGYLVQQIIGSDGVTMLTPTGATQLAETSSTPATVGDSDEGWFGVKGLRLRFP